MKFIGAEASWEEAGIVLFGAPFDSTTSYRPGTRFGPAAMRTESFGIETYSPLQDADLEDVKYHDAGDLELPFGDAARALDMIEAQAGAILDADKIPFLLGGEHLVTLGAVRAAAKRFAGLNIIHFDAHADLRDDYLGVKLSHACVMRRCHDILGDGRIWQCGIRSGTREEFAFRKNRIGHLQTLPDAPVYLTIDMDVLDPSEFPGTGTPEAGGMRYRELLDAVLGIIRRCNVVAIDNVELSPPLDPTGRSTALACKFLREEILALDSK